jgi:hypothetical protein
MGVEGVHMGVGGEGTGVPVQVDIEDARVSLEDTRGC